MYIILYFKVSYLETDNEMTVTSKAVLFVSLLTMLHGRIFAQDEISETVSPNVEHTVLRLPNIHPGRDAIFSYATALLSQALTATEDKYGSFEIVVTEQESAQERQLRSLEHNMLDVTWSVASIEREQHFLPVRIPIMAGLFGKRVLLVRRGDKRLSHVSTLEELQSFRAVMGYDWPDTKVFRANKLPILETTYRASFRIVAEGFADMFPRSVMEVQEEFENKALSRGLVIEESVVLSYDNPVFFFVASDNTALANRITEGLLILIESGQFHALLMQQEGFKQGMSLLTGRNVIPIHNPLLSDQSRAALQKYLPLFIAPKLHQKQQ